MFRILILIYHIFFFLKNYLVILKYFNIFLTYTLHDIRYPSSKIE